MDLKPEIKIGEFVLKRKLGKGSLGEVWLAYNPAMQRYIALKLLSYELLSDNILIERFLQEAKILGQLQHPNIITVFKIGQDKDFYYLASRYIDGINLKEKLETEKIFKEKYALRIIYTIAEALEYAWDNFSIHHHDIKPANIMLDADENISLMDLGISKNFENNQQINKSAIVIGTPYYMSPEQARGENNINFKADIYSLGGTLFHFVTGKFPFNANSPIGILTKHITDPLPDPVKINPALSQNCSKLIKWMMEKSPRKRPKNWHTVIEAIERVRDGLPPKPKTKKKQKAEPQLKKINYTTLDKAQKNAKTKNLKQIPIPSTNNTPNRFIGKVVAKKPTNPTQITIPAKNNGI